MSHVSPTLEGFRSAIRRPSLTFAEISWRWTLGATAWALSLFSFFEYLNTLPVTRTDATLLSTRHPALVGRALAHIFHGSLNRAVFAVLLGALALAVLWIVAASLGRAATVRSLLDYFAESKDVDNNVLAADSQKETRPFRSLLVLNFLRVVVGLAALLAFIGTAILVTFASPHTNPRPGLAFVLFLPLAGLICLAWSTLTWILSLAAIFTVRNGGDALSALSAAVTFCRERTGPVFAVSTWTGLAHLVAFSIATTAVSLPLSIAQIAPSRLILACVLVVTLIYFAVVDWLYIARIGGYLCIAEMPETLVSSATTPVPPPPGQQFQPSIPVETMIDRDEPILSDLPNLDVLNLALET
jgi:hypothetical protein